MKVEHGNFCCLPNCYSATCALCDYRSSNHMEDREVFRHVGGRSAPDAGQGDSLQVWELPLHLHPGQVRGETGKELSHIGAKGENTDRGALYRRAI